MEPIGRWVLGMGVLLVVVGIVLIAAGKLGLPLGRLPGDIAIERDGFRLYFPLGTGIAISVVLSLVLWVLSKLR
jgi:uncharacterized protein HemY